MNVGVLGDGAWGTALAMVLCQNGHDACLWGYDAAYLDAMAVTRQNAKFLPGVTLPQALRFTPDMRTLAAQSDYLISAIPTKFLRATLAPLAGRGLATPIISVTKGIEPGTMRRPTEIIREIVGDVTLGVLSGPSHAEEVARRRPTTVVVACPSDAVAQQVQASLMNETFRVYTSPDLLGVELGGALKNVLALAGGICVGLGLGDNALCALITRGLAEMTRFGSALGAQPKTFYGLSGIGDLVVTCISEHGRNRAVGIALGQGKKLDEILGGMQGVAEGVTAARGVQELAQKYGINMPITDEVVNILDGGADPRNAVANLMRRDPREE